MLTNLWKLNFAATLGLNLTYQYLHLLGYSIVKSNRKTDILCTEYVENWILIQFDVWDDFIINPVISPVASISMKSNIWQLYVW